MMGCTLLGSILYCNWTVMVLIRAAEKWSEGPGLSHCCPLMDFRNSWLQEGCFIFVWTAGKWWQAAETSNTHTHTGQVSVVPLAPVGWTVQLLRKIMTLLVCPHLLGHKHTPCRTHRPPESDTLRSERLSALPGVLPDIPVNLHL